MIHFVSYIRDLLAITPTTPVAYHHRSGIPLAEVTTVFTLSPDTLFCTVACPYCGFGHSHTLVRHDLRCHDAGPRLSHCRLTAMRFGDAAGGEYRVVLNDWARRGAVVEDRNVVIGPRAVVD